MQQADETAIGLIVLDDQEQYIAGHVADIQRLYDAGLVDRAWYIALDNGHRPYAAIKKRLTYDNNEMQQPIVTKNILTTYLEERTGLIFANNLHALHHTYLVRTSPTFWSGIEVVFADEDGRLREADLSKYYALFAGSTTSNGNIRFMRMDITTLV